jgi:hypothetical protein
MGIFKSKNTPLLLSILLAISGCGDETKSAAATNSNLPQEVSTTLRIFPTRLEAYPRTPLHFVAYDQGAHSNSFFSNCIPVRNNSELDWNMTEAPETAGLYTIRVTDKLDATKTATATLVVSDHPFFSNLFPPNFCENP